MKITIYGATGNIGQRLVAEALRRGHSVIAVVRDPSRVTENDPKLTVVKGDATDAAGVAAMVVGSDVVIGSVSGRRDGDAGQIAAAARAMLAGVAQAGGVRLLWVGGAGSLEVAPGVRLMDSPQFPEAYRAEANAGLEALNAFRAADPSVEWSYLSPAAEIAPGERTGNFRLGGDNLVTDATGHSRISTEDYAVALIDEAEKPEHTRQRFTVGY
jgi:putative NADH-flavin reductase